MTNSIDFSRGGYMGDATEQAFVSFTKEHMPFWWHFREILRASDRTSDKWRKADGTPLSDNEQKELVALSLLNYSVYIGIAEACAFLGDIRAALNNPRLPSGQRRFEVLRKWKALYSSLYTSINGVSNIITIVVSVKPPFTRDKRDYIRNYTPKDAFGLVNGRGINIIAAPLDRCDKRAEIRSHLDHFWTIWHFISQGRFLIDGNFSKGYIPLRPEDEVEIKVDACAQAEQHIQETAQDFNLIYKELSITGSWFDQYLQHKGWKIDYSDYGEPHNHSRPKP